MTQLVYTNSTELLFAALTLYHLRTVERLWGSRKFLSFILLLYPWTSILPPLILALIIRPLSFGHLNYLPAGPTPLLFALLAQWHAATPSTYTYKLGTTSSAPSPNQPSSTAPPEQPSSSSPTLTLTLTSKTTSYVVPAQLALSQFPHTLLAALVGWAAGIAYRNELLPFTSWRVPGWVLGRSGSGSAAAAAAAGVDQLRRRLEAEARADASAVDRGGPLQQPRRRTLGGLLRDQFLGGGGR